MNEQLESDLREALRARAAARPAGVRRAASPASTIARGRAGCGPRWRSGGGERGHGRRPGRS